MVSRGFALQYALDLPLENFDALVQMVDRVKAEDELRYAWTSIHAAQAKGEDFAQYTKSAIEPRLGPNRPKGKKPRSL